jgi:hypothetical protein
MRLGVEVLVGVATVAAIAQAAPSPNRIPLPRGGRFLEARIRVQSEEATLDLWPFQDSDIKLGHVSSDSVLHAVAPDGHAIAWSDDRKVWRAVYLDGPRPFACGHHPVNPRAIALTREVVLDVLSAAHPESEDAELEGALAWALNASGDLEVSAAAQRWLWDPSNRERSVALKLEDLWPRPPPELVAPTPPPEPRLPDPPCRPTPMDRSPLPEQLTLEQAVARLAFPDRADAQTCAMWEALKTRISAETERGRKLTKLATDADLFCANVLRGIGFERFLHFRLADFGAEERLDRERALCGHIDQRDLACEKRAVDRADAQLAQEREAERRKVCGAHEQALEVARHCIQQLEEVHGDPEQYASSSSWIWLGLEGIVGSAKETYCPLPAPRWNEPLPRSEREQRH